MFIQKDNLKYRLLDIIYDNDTINNEHYYSLKKEKMNG